MGIFDNFFKSEARIITQKNSKIDWNVLTSVKQIDDIKQDSENKPVGVFKHSTRCGISSVVLKRFNKMFPVEANIKMYYLDLLACREVSNQVSCEFNVVHQSPQLLIIKNKEVVENASHYDILNIELV